MDTRVGEEIFHRDGPSRLVRSFPQTYHQLRLFVASLSCHSTQTLGNTHPNFMQELVRHTVGYVAHRMLMWVVSVGLFCRAWKNGAQPREISSTSANVQSNEPRITPFLYSPFSIYSLRINGYTNTSLQPHHWLAVSHSCLQNTTWFLPSHGMKTSARSIIVTGQLYLPFELNQNPTWCS